MWGKKNNDEEKWGNKKNDLWNDTWEEPDTENGVFDEDTANFDGSEYGLLDGEKNESSSSSNSSSSGSSSSSSDNGSVSALLTESEKKALEEAGYDMDKVPKSRLPSEITAGIIFLSHYVEGFVMGGMFGVLVAGNEYYQGHVGRLSPSKFSSHVGNHIMKHGHSLGTLVGLYHGAKRLSREYRLDYKETMIKMNRDTTGVSNDYTTIDSFMGGFAAGLYPGLKSRRAPLKTLIMAGGLGLVTAAIDGGVRWNKSLNSSNDNITSDNGQQQ